jgi:AcrR family transcriptional regulator
VSRRTFFRYFGSKDDVVFGYEDEQLDALREAVRAHPGAARDFAALGAAPTGFAESLARDYAPLVERARLVAVNPPLARRSFSRSNGCGRTRWRRSWPHSKVGNDPISRSRWRRPAASPRSMSPCAWFGGPAGGSLLPIVTEALEQVAALGVRGSGARSLEAGAHRPGRDLTGGPPSHRRAALPEPRLRRRHLEGCRP